MKSRNAVIVAAALILVAGGADAQTHPDTTAIDQAVISKLSAQFGINSKVIRHLDLTQPFQTKSQQSLVAAKQPDEESSAEDGAGRRTLQNRPTERNQNKTIYTLRRGTRANIFVRPGLVGLY